MKFFSIDVKIYILKFQLIIHFKNNSSKQNLNINFRINF
jgi:hypothetical protein